MVAFTVHDQPLRLGGDYDVYDHEIDNVGKRLAFLDLVRREAGTRLGTVYVQPLDPASGAALGHAIEIDADATMSRQPGNGPEWAHSVAGTSLYYTRVGPAGARGVRVTELTGAPVGHALDWSDDIGAFEPSKSPEYEHPIILYVDLVAQTGFWCEDRPGRHVRYAVPDAAVGAFLSGSPVRHVPEQRAVVMSLPVPATGVTRLVWRNLIRREDIVEEFEIARFSPTTTVVSVNAVAAPSRNDRRGRAYVVYAIVDFAAVIAWLVRVGCGCPEVEGTYVHRLPEAPNPHLTDDENFVDAQGEPHLAITRSSDASDFDYASSDIWVLPAFPPGAPWYRQVSRSDPPAVADEGQILTTLERRDPEPLRLADGSTSIVYRERERKGEEAGPYGLRIAATGV